MRWFKHMTDSPRDKKLSALRSEFGLEGYGFWWSVIEIVAEQCGENNQTSAEFSAKTWGNLLGISPKKFQTLAEFCANLELFLIKYREKYIRIDIPNILKFRDEWSRKKDRNSGVTPEKLQPSRARDQIQIQNIDPDTDITLNLNSKVQVKEKGITNQVSSAPALPDAASLCEVEPDFYLTRKKRKLVGKRLESFERFWKCFGYAKGKAEAADAWLDIPKLTERMVEQICLAATQEAQHRQTMIASGKTPKMAQGWITGRRWEDSPDIVATNARPTANSQWQLDRQRQEDMAAFALKAREALKNGKTGADSNGIEHDGSVIRPQVVGG